jgi:hypothetical protein
LSGIVGVGEALPRRQRVDGDQDPAPGRPGVERALRARLAVAVLVAVLVILAAAGCNRFSPGTPIS